MVFYMNSVAGRDSLGSCFGLPCGMLMGDASEVVPAGYSYGSLFGVIVKGPSGVISLGDYIVFSFVIDQDK